MTSSSAQAPLPVAERFAIIHGIRHGYDRMLDRFVDDFMEAHVALEGEEAADHYRRFVSGQKLLKRRSRDLGFNAYVIQQVLSRGDFQVIRDRLLKGVLGSLVLEGQLNRAVLERKPEDRQAARERGEGIRGAGKGLEPEIVGRFIAKWPEVFTRLPGDAKDASRYSTAFDPIPKEEGESPISQDAFEAYTRERFEADLLSYPAHFIPEYLHSLEAFREAWIKALQSLADEKDAIPARIQWLQDEAKRASSLPIVLHLAVVDILCLHWIAEKRRDDLAALQTSAKLSLAGSQARELHDQLAQLGGSKFSLTALYVGGLYYKRWGCFNGAKQLWETALSSTEASDEQRANLHASIGVIHRDQSNPKLAVRAFLNAVEFLRRDAHPYELAVALKNLGEARALNNHERPARESYAEAFSIAASLSGQEKQDIAWNLVISCRRAGLRDLERAALELFVRTDPQDTDEVIYTNLRLTELGPYAGGRELPLPFELDPEGASPDERRAFLLRVSDQTIQDEITPGPDSGFEELLDEVQPLLERPFRSRPGGGFGFQHMQASVDPSEFSRVAICFSNDWVGAVRKLAEKHGFSAQLLLTEFTQIVTHDRLELLDSATGPEDPLMLRFDEELRVRLTGHLAALFDRFRGDLPTFYLFQILSVEDAVEDVMYHFFGVRIDDGRPLVEVHGSRPPQAPDWIPVYWRYEGSLSRQERRRRERK